MYNKNRVLSFDLSSKKITESCEQSLKRLKIDYLDGLLFHVLPSKNQLMESILTLEKLKKQGKILYWGASTNNLLFIKGLVKINQNLNNDYFFVEYNHNIFSKQEELYQYLQQNKIIPIIRGALANGVLQENFFTQRIHGIKKEDFRSALSFQKYQTFYQEIYHLKNQFNEANDISLSQIAILYLIDKLNTLNLKSSILLGVKSIEQLKELVTVKKNSLNSIKELLIQIEKLKNIIKIN